MGLNGVGRARLHAGPGIDGSGVKVDHDLVAGLYQGLLLGIAAAAGFLEKDDVGLGRRRQALAASAPRRSAKSA